MSYIGSAYLNIVPKFDGLSASVEKELGSVSTSGFEGKVQSGFNRAGMFAGAFAAVTQRAMAVVSSSVGDAVSRVDTLNNYPRIMESLGYGADIAENSINKMSERLSVLPTRLDTMASSVQGLTVVTRDLTKATDLGLAVNDMLLSSGANQQMVNSAQEQFRQILAKGKPEMQDWKSLLQTAPGQIDQVAKAMLGVNATAQDLYSYLGGGEKGAYYPEHIQEFIDTIIRLDSEGGEGFASFQQQAENATNGIATSMANTQNAVVRGIGGILDKIGQDRISGVFSDIKGGINDTFSIVQNVVADALPYMEDIYSTAKGLAPKIAEIGGAFLVYKGVSGILSGISGGFINLKNSLKTMGPSTVIGVLAGITAFAITTMNDMNKAQKDFEKTTIGVADAVDRAKNLDAYAGYFTDIATNSNAARKSLDDLRQSQIDHADAIITNTDNAEAQISQLNSAKSIIEQYIGQTDLSTEAQGRLHWALELVNEQFGLTLGSQEVLQGFYEDQEGAVHNLREELENLVETKKKEIKMNMLTENLTEAYQMEEDAAEEYGQLRAQTDLAKRDAMLDALQKMPRGEIGSQIEQEYREAQASYETEFGDFEKSIEKLNSAKKTRTNYEEMLGDLSKAASEAATELDKWAEKAGVDFQKVLENNGHGATMAMLKEDLAEVSANTEQLSNLAPDELLKIADAYDGTVQSIAGVLKELGVDTDTAKTDIATAAEDIANTIRGLAPDIERSLGVIDIDILSRKLAEAGVSIETLSSLSSEELAALAESCQYNVDAMVTALTAVSTFTIGDKTFYVSDDGTVSDGIIQLGELNGFTLDDHHYYVTDDGTVMEEQNEVAKLRDAITRVPDSKTTKFTADTSSAIWSINNLETRIKNINGKQVTIMSGTVPLIKSQNAEGGIRYHADGAFIATKATPLDIVGEAGAEAIVPLTNRRYSLPFATLIAELVAEANNGTPQVIDKSVTINGLEITGRSGEEANEAFREMFERLGWLENA